MKRLRGGERGGGVRMRGVDGELVRGERGYGRVILSSL